MCSVVGITPFRFAQIVRTKCIRPSFCKGQFSTPRHGILFYRSRDDRISYGTITEQRQVDTVLCYINREQASVVRTKKASRRNIFSFRIDNER